MKRLRFLIATALACSAVIAGACSTFSGTDDEPQPAGNDASTDTNGGGQDAASDANASSDAGTDATACSASTPIFADDFASGGTSKWDPSSSNCTNASVSVVDGSAVLGCASDVTDAFHVLLSKTQLPVKRRMQIEFAASIGSKDPHTFAQLVALFGASGDNLAFLYTGTGVELRRSSNKSQTFTSWSPVSTGQLHAITLEFEAKDPGATSFDVRAKLDDDVKTFSMQRNLDGGVPNAGVQIGVFLTETTGAFSDSYDNVRVWSCD